MATILAADVVGYDEVCRTGRLDRAEDGVYKLADTLASKEQRA